MTSQNHGCKFPVGADGNTGAAIDVVTGGAAAMVGAIWMLIRLVASTAGGLTVLNVHSLAQPSCGTKVSPRQIIKRFIKLLVPDFSANRRGILNRNLPHATDSTNAIGTFHPDISAKSQQSGQFSAIRAHFQKNDQSLPRLCLISPHLLRDGAARRITKDPRFFRRLRQSNERGT